jgi:hydrogenase maturation factor
MARASQQAGVPIVTADTKVVERGKGDGIFITTTGVGVQPPGRELGGALARPGDAIIVSGTIGDHGVAIMSQRESLSFAATIVSDTAALHGLVGALRAHPLGVQAAIIGEVVADERRFVQLNTTLGGRRIVDWLAGDQLPRIC